MCKKRFLYFSCLSDDDLQTVNSLASNIESDFKRLLEIGPLLRNEMTLSDRQCLECLQMLTSWQLEAVVACQCLYRVISFQLHVQFCREWHCSECHGPPHNRWQFGVSRKFSAINKKSNEKLVSSSWRLPKWERIEHQPLPNPFEWVLLHCVPVESVYQLPSGFSYVSILPFPDPIWLYFVVSHVVY